MKTCQSTGYFQQACIRLLLCFISSVVFAASAFALTGNNIDQCYDCHGSPLVPGPADIRPLDATYRNITTGGFIGNHRTHIQTATTNTNTCAECHGPAPTAMDHRNGKISFPTNINNSRVNGQYNGGVTFVNQTSLPTRYTCTNIDCHFETATPQWGQPTASIWSTNKTANDNNVNCANCHLATGLATGKHAIHITASGGTQTACAKCHPDYNTLASTAAFSHATTGKGPITVTFAAAPNLGGLYTGGRTGNNFLPSALVAATGTCNNIYCHSSGNINDFGGAVAPTTYKSPAWNATSVGCAACHGDGLAGGKAHPVYATGPAASKTANSHVKHVESSLFSCDYCHNTTTTNTTIPPTTVINGGAHLNKTDDVSFKTNGGKTGTYAAAAKTCSTTYCHGTGPSVAWGGASTCVSCHDAINTGLALRHDKHYNSATAPTVLVGGVDAHTTTTYVYSCLACHPSNQHSTGPASAIAPLQDAAVTGLKITAYLKGTASAVDGKGYNYTTNGTCTSVCHTKDGVTAGSAVVAQNWGTAATGTCGVCHNKAGDAGPTWTTPHTVHINTYAANTNITCASCHAGTATNSTTINGVTGRNQHPNGNKELAMNTFATGGVVVIAGAQGTQTCSNTYCHSNGTIAAGTHIAIPWSGAMTCASCHGNAATLATGSHANHLTSGATCNSCHNATASNNTTVTGFANHVNKTVTINFAAAAAPAGGTYNGQIAGGASVYQKGVATAVGSCSATVCHGTGVTPAWGSNTANATCTKCHGKPTVLANYSTTNAWQAAPGYAQVAGSGTYTDNVSNTAPYGAHDAHVRSVNNYTGLNITCDNCHGALPATGSHANGTVAVTFSNLAKNIGTSGGNVATGPSTRGTLASAYTAGTCSAVYCHGGVMAGTDTTPAWTFTGVSYLTPYAKTVANCGKCHAALPVVAAKDHSAMVFASTACTSCHGHEGNGPKHIDGILQASGACNACHGYQAGSWATSPVINVGGIGAHDKHITYLTTKRFTVTLNPLVDNYNADTAGMGGTWTNVCGICHGNTPANHNTGTVNVSISATYLFGASGSPTYNGAPGGALSSKTCSNISCHYFTTPVWSN